MLLNVGKCKTITFSRSCHLIGFYYMLGQMVLDRISSNNDLGVMVALAMLKFIRAFFAEFRDP
jgi:hypothetical protein